MCSSSKQNPILFNKPFCKFGNQCPKFIRLVNSNDYPADDIDHCSKEFHPGRRCGMTIGENFQSEKFKTAYQNCSKVRAHQRNRNFWGGKVNNGDLSEEVKTNGFVKVLTSNLYERVKEKLIHERHIQMRSPLLFEQMLAIILYTDTELYKELRQDEIEFSMQDVTVDSEYVRKQQWPIFGRTLNSAICCLNKYDRNNRPLIVYHGLHGIKIDPIEFNNSGYENRPKSNPFFKYGTFISTSQHKEVAFSFMGFDGRVTDEYIGSMFEIDTRRDEDGNEIIGSDVSWISKFPDEGEFLIARLVQLGINDLQFDPDKMFYIAKTSVEFFAHRGQMCLSLEHDMNECNCDFQVGRRPSWIPLPENMAAKITTNQSTVDNGSGFLTTESEPNSNDSSKKRSSSTSNMLATSSFLSPTGLTSLITFIVLSCAYISGFMSRLFSVIRFESIIHEFDPWFNYRSTAYMTENGFYNFLNWFDELAWYPLGRIVGGTVYPGLMVTSGLIHWFLHMINIPIHIREICVFLAPFFSGLTAIATYLFTKELWSRRAGLFAAAFIAIAPGYSSRSVAGSYDNEGIAIFALMFTYFLWIRSVKTGSVFWSSCTALSYFYMVSAWGGYVFIINLIPVHVFVLLVLRRFSLRLYVSYSIFYILGLILSMQIPFVGFQPVRTSEHMLAAGVFALLQAYAFIDYLYTKLPRTSDLKQLFFGLIIIIGLFVFAVVVVLTYAGYIAPWSGRFYSLWDTNYAKIHIPIIASVSEHQPTTWTSFFFDLHLLICLFPVGAWFCIKELNDERVFIVLYAVFASYFAGVMIRLMLTLTPCVCVLAAIALSKTLDYYADTESSDMNSSPVASTNDDDGSDNENETNDKNSRSLYDKAGKSKTTTGRRGPSGTNQEGEDESNIVSSNIKTIVVICIAMMLMLFAVHCTWVTSNAYSSPSIVLASYNNDGSRYIIDDFREAYYWLRKNTPERARVMSWWDYGYQIAGMGNRTVLVDNNTWNNSHIALVGKAMSSNETEAYKIMTMLDVDYILVIFGGMIGYSGDDINKFLWMVRIAEGEHPKDIREQDYFTESGEFRVDRSGSPILLNCLMYKLCYYRFGELQTDFRSPPGFDRTRNVEIGNKNFDLQHVEEAYTTEHWIVRIYKVKKLENRLQAKNVLRQVQRRKSIYSSSKKSSGQVRKQGVILNKPEVKKGIKVSKRKT